MKKKKGFTLIELLAIIVILAVIAVITVPIILNIVDNAKEKAAVDSAYGYKDSIANSYLSSLLNDSDQVLNGNYMVTDGRLGELNIPFSGTAPTTGSLIYENNKLVSGCLTINGYKIEFQDGKFVSLGKGECDGGESQKIERQAQFHRQRGFTLPAGLPSGVQLSAEHGHSRLLQRRDVYRL